jgi:hypothetical protein
MPIHHTPQSSNLLEVLEKILDKGVVIAGDIKISLADVDLLTIKIRLLIASVDKAREIGMDWWEKDSYYSSRAKVIEEEHALLKEKINLLEQQLKVRELPSQVEKNLLPQVESKLPENIDLTQAAEPRASDMSLMEKMEPEVDKDAKES